MALYFADTEITGIKNLIPLSSKDITGLYFADTELFTVWGEYDGTLPATYSANGSVLADYQIYGSAGGVGDDSGTAYGYELDMATGSNILQSSEIEQGGWYASAGMIPQKMDNLNRCRSKDIYTFSSNKIFYDAKSINMNIAFADSYGVSLGGVGFKTGAGSVAVPANASKCFFIIANTNTSENITPTQVIAAGVWASVDATTTPIYIGDTPLGEDEYVSFKEQKVYRRTENRFNPAAYTATGQYLTYAGGLYAGAAWRISDYIPITSGEAYTITSLVGQYPAYCWYKSNKEYISGARYDVSGGFANRTITAPANAAYLRFSYVFDSSSASYNEDKCMVVEGSTAPSTYIPYLQPTDPPVPLPAIPTVDGTNIVDYAGQSAAVPSRFVAKYRKEGFE